jgi:hypothetical protein
VSGGAAVGHRRRERLAAQRVVRLRHVACGLALASSLLAPALQAQTPSAPSDTGAAAKPKRDSSATHPVVDNPLGLLLVPLGLAAFVALRFGPGPAAMVMGNRDPTHGSRFANHGAIAMSVGGTFHGGQTWSNGATLEGVRGHAYGELTVEDFWRPRHLQYVSARGGYLWYPAPNVAGGMSLGYMHADADRAQRGPELGLPLFFGDSVGRQIRFEPTYVVGHRLLFNYRLQVRVPVAGSRFFVGGSFVGKGDPPPSSAEYRGDFTHTGYMLLLGSRF